MSNSKIVFGYWSLRGMGQPSRLLAAYLGLELDEKRYTAVEEWFTEKFNLDLAFPNLPYLKDGDLKLTESRAILKYLARKYGQTLYPSKSEDLTTCDMIENVLFDTWWGSLRYFNMADLEPIKKYFDNEVPNKLKYLNSFLENKKFVLGEQISYVDFILYEMSYHLTAFQSDYLNKYSNIVQFKKRFEEIPAIAKYINSEAYIKAPCVNPFGKITF